MGTGTGPWVRVRVPWVRVRDHGYGYGYHGYGYETMGMGMGMGTGPASVEVMGTGTGMGPIPWVRVRNFVPGYGYGYYKSGGVTNYTFVIRTCGRNLILILEMNLLTPNPYGTTQKIILKVHKMVKFYQNTKFLTPSLKKSFFGCYRLIFHPILLKKVTKCSGHHTLII